MKQKCQNKTMCAYKACMSNECRLQVMGRHKGIKPKCGKTLVDTRTKRKYNLHYKVRKEGFTIISSSKTIFTHTEKAPSKGCYKLRDEFAYVIQLKMF